MTDPLQRFVDAQDGVYATALAELRRGRKTSHWMWFVFPQLAGLGRSEMAQRYAIVDIDEARSYLAHPVLGPRLRECTEVVALCSAPTAVDIFGGVDAQKLHSSMTLFRLAAPDEPGFAAVLERYFDGVDDPGTTARL